MNDILREIILRVFCSGLICTVALIVAGEGAGREPVRLCCAALVVVTLATPLKGSLGELDNMDYYTDSLRTDIERELDDAASAEYKLVCDKVGTNISNRLNNAGVECTIDIETGLIGNMFEIKSVYIKGRLTEVQKSRAVNILAAEYGVARDKIFFEEIQ